VCTHGTCTPPHCAAHRRASCNAVSRGGEGCGQCAGPGGSPSMCPPAAGTPELHTHHLIPSLRQVVFQGDRLPFQCTATYLDNSTQIHWYHNRQRVQEDERAGVIVEESLIHDCTFITRWERDGNGMEMGIEM